MNTLNKSTSRNIKILLIACALLTSAMILGCGRLPPEKLWTGDSDDTIGVKKVIVDYNTGNWSDFLSRLDFDTIIDPLRFSKTRVFPADEVATLEFKIKQAYWPSRLQIKLTSQETDTNINFVYDTTATVELITKIKGIARVGCDSVQNYLRDTVIGTDTLMLFGGWTNKRFLHDTIIRGDTVLVSDTLLPGYDSIVLVKEFEGQIWRSLFFEPMREDTLASSTILSPRVWKMTKICGGVSVRIPDSEDDAPYIYWTIVKEKGIFAADTFYNRPDSIHFGVQRLYSFPKSIWSYAPTRDSLEIPTTTNNNGIYPILNPQDTAFYLAYGDRYYSLSGFGSDGRLKLGGAAYPNNLNYFSVMICPRQGLIYKNSPFKLRVWQMPVRIE